ncbi:MAG: HEPN domain-containing protein [Bacteroidota bacterium]
MKKFLVKLFQKGQLQIVEKSEEICNAYVKKSASNFDSAKILLENNKLEEAVSLIYYSMYNLVVALLFKVGVKSENHTASIFLLKEVFNIENSEIVNAKKERIDKQYYVDFGVTKKEVDEMLKIAEEFNRNIKGFLSGLNLESIEGYRNKIKEIVNE